MVEKIQKALIDAQISFTDVNTYTDGTYEVIIEWGDWKHDHILCNEVMAELGFELEGEYELDEDGSDCYSSSHQYKLKEK